MIKKPYSTGKIAAVAFIVWVQASHADIVKDEAIELSFGSGEMPSLALGYPAPENLSPSVTSVMTSKDIERIGARRLQDVLEYLPGVHVGTARTGVSVIGFRGIYSEANSQVVVLVNGIPLRNTLIGGKPFAWTMPVKNISHVEIIRGPGSMLYGGDATTGVINVVKTGKQLKGGDVGGYFGSQDTYEGWAEYGNHQGDWEYSLSLQDGSTRGNRGRVEQDAQSFLDRQFGTQASIAPGYTLNGRNDVDVRLDVAYQDWVRLRAGYQLFNQVQPGEGAGSTLDNGTGRTDEHLFNVDLSFKNHIADDLKNDTTFYFLGQNQKTKGYILPPGTFGGLLPQGFFQSLKVSQNTVGLSSHFNYTGIKKHNVTIGTGLNYTWITDASNQTNAIITASVVQQINLTELSTLGKDPLLTSKNRTNYYALIQDEWNFARDWYLTLGFRYDDYSDVDPGYSPRAALIWNVSPIMTTKLLYSRAFRPPSFLEKNQPVLPGTAIKSETVNTVEFQVENNWSSKLNTSANVYWFQMDHLITSTSTNTVTPVGFINSGPIDGVGVETEVRYKAIEGLDLSVNYSYHGLPDTEATGIMPAHMIKALAHWEFTQGWFIGTQINWIGERKRQSNDARSNLGGYFMAGVTLSTKVGKSLELTLRANNLLGVNAKEPSLNPALFPSDVPVNERSILGQIKWSF